jgi:hypothetical protein
VSCSKTKGADRKKVSTFLILNFPMLLPRLGNSRGKLKDERGKMKVES